MATGKTKGRFTGGLLCLIVLIGCGPTPVARHNEIVRSEPHAAVTVVGHCLSRQLSFRQASDLDVATGNDVGGGTIFNHSRHECSLDTAGLLIALYDGDKPTNARQLVSRIRAKQPKRIVMTARSTPPPNGSGGRHGQVVAFVSIDGEYRDGAGPRDICVRKNEDAPAEFTLRVGRVKLHLRNGIQLADRSNIIDGRQPILKAERYEPVVSCGTAFTATLMASNPA